jgi:hypothetical protein
VLNFLYRYGTWLFFAYILGAGFFLIAIESTFNGGFNFSVCVLWLPLALLVFGFTFLNRKFLYAKVRSRWNVRGLAIVFYPILLLMTWPYVMALNAITGSGVCVTYTGAIQRKWVHHSPRYGDSYEIDVLNTATSRTNTFTIPRDTYDQLRVGDIYVTKFLSGGFGIPYRWRFQPIKESDMRVL